jgi:hypothetical protein
MIASLFLVFVAVMAGLVITLAFRYQTHRSAVQATVVLLLWLSYVGLMSYSGVLRNPALRPPGIVYILLPVFLYIVIGPLRSRAVVSIPISFLLFVQAFRIVVELFLHQLWRNGVVPKMLTFEGANFDILVGLSAPLAAWISTRGRRGLQLALVWSWLGLLCLANTAARFVFTTPGPLHLLHTEIPNLAPGTFPYTFIPGLFAPLAVILHILAIRALARQLATGVEPSTTMSEKVAR